MSPEQIEQLRKIHTKLEDIKNSQQSIIDKINHVITDLFEHPDAATEKAMETAHQKASDNIEAVMEAMEELEMRINKAENEA
ncbi:MAG: hypothetical protein WCD31_00840 [Gillisia sp.]